MTDIAKVNSNVAKWKAKDYLNCYKKQGNQDYNLMSSFFEKYNFSVGVCLNLLAYGIPGKSNGEVIAGIHKIFETGTFEIKEYDKAVAIAELCKQFEFFPNWRSRDFIQAIYRIQEAEKIKFPDLVKTIEANKNMLTQQATWKDYIFKLEYIMNLGKHNRIVLI